MNKSVLTIVALCSGLALSAWAHAAPTPAQYTTQPRAGFNVNPLVHRFKAHPGQTLRFKFDLSSLSGETSVQVTPVGLVQEPSGQISPSDKAVPPGLRMLSQPQFTLKPGVSSAIEGIITVPPDSTMCVFGLLVRDMGRPMPARPRDLDRTTISVRFVTQYLLRIEVEVSGGRGASVNDLRIQSGQLVEDEGKAIASVLVNNPTATAIPLEARCRLLRRAGDKFVPVGEFFKLGHPNRAGREGEGRYEARVLGSAVVKLEAPVPEAIFPGEYRLEVQLAPPGKPARQTSAFALAVPDDAFPAQRAVVARVVDAVQINPAHLVLSTQRGGNRMTTLHLHNSGAETVKVRITPRAFGDVDVSDWVTVRPDTFELRSGAKRGAMVTMSKRGDVDAPAYLTLDVHVEPDGRPGGTHGVPVALLLGPTTTPIVSIGQARFDATERAIIVPVRNTGSTHVVLDARLRMSDAFERGLNLRAGFGRWLLPGQQEELHFRLGDHRPPAGEYDLRGSLSIGPDAPTQSLAGRIDLSDTTRVTQVDTAP